MLAIDPALVDMDEANVEFPRVANPASVHTAFFFSAPGSVYRATSNPARGDRCVKRGIRRTLISRSSSGRQSGASTTSSGRSR